MAMKNPPHPSRSVRQDCLEPLGLSVTDAARKLGVTEITFYRWKKQYTGLDVSELRELKQLRDEDRRLKHVVRISHSTSRCCASIDRRTGSVHDRESQRTFARQNFRCENLIVQSLSQF